ncbi:carbohydrate esterase family 4 protein [Mycena floridula]|nr:carbohydrate esterase family 4 protein [Mycena floridula]
MLVISLATLFVTFTATNAHLDEKHVQLAKRQLGALAAASSAGASATKAANGAATLTASGVPALASITLGMASGTPVPLSKTFTPGASAPISAATTIPTFVFSPGDWPAADKPPDPTSPEVLEWMKELNGHHIPDISMTVDGTCASSPEAAANAFARGWWSCGGYTRDTDITVCPDPKTWGVSFDDGPSPYTPKLLKYLSEKDISATFFVVGSRVISYPQTLVAEYEAGHEIAVHTWSHTHLTTQSNAQIVAELGWTRKAIKAVIGVTPLAMRPPFGDADDRVRAIALAMGLVPIQWTRTPAGVAFDTNDWKVAGGMMTGVEQYNTFQSILGNASTLDTGFCVLQHDLFEITVDLAIGYTIPAALNANFKLEAIGKCSGFPARNIYRETTTNTTFPYKDGSSSNSSGASTNSGLSLSYIFALAFVLNSAIRS